MVANVPVRLEMLVGVLHHVLHGVLPPVTDAAEELKTAGRSELLYLHLGLVAHQMVQHSRSVREQNVETAQPAVDPKIERQK